MTGSSVACSSSSELLASDPEEAAGFLCNKIFVNKESSRAENHTLDSMNRGESVL